MSALSILNPEFLYCRKTLQLAQFLKYCIVLEPNLGLSSLHARRTHPLSKMQETSRVYYSEGKTYVALGGCALVTFLGYRTATLLVSLLKFHRNTA